MTEFGRQGRKTLAGDRECRIITISGQYGCPLLETGLGDGRPDAAGGSGDEDVFAG